jgi:xylan 1,4-beta-xylosidase
VNTARRWVLARARVLVMGCALGCADHTLVLIEPAGMSAQDASADASPDSSAGAVVLVPSLSVSVAWDQPTGRVATTRHHGVTSIRGADPALSGKPGEPLYRQNLTQMRSGLLRVWHPDIVEEASLRASGWLVGADTATPAWDRTKISRVMDGLRPTASEIMVTIGRWPSGLGIRSAPLPAAGRAAFAALCADLVRALNVEQRRGIRYFEIFAEVEENAFAGLGDALGRLVGEVALAMKAVDRNVLVGGAGFVQVYAKEIAPFIAAAAPHIDFVSYHGYGTGNASEDLARVFATARRHGELVDVMAKTLSDLDQRQLAIFQTQWSLNWTVDPRMIDARGAVFDALSLSAFAASAATGSTGWNDSDGWYGKLDSGFRARPAAAVFRLFNEHATGPVVTASSDDETKVFAFAVAEPRRRALVLINQIDAPLVVGVRAIGATPFGAGLRQVVVSGDGSFESVEDVFEDAPAGASWRGPSPAGVLPPMSVTILHEP